MTTDELKERFRKFTIRIVRLVNAMPNTIAGNAIAKQIIRSGTSPGANYSAACLAKSNKDFLNKLKMVEEEIDETAHWLSVIMDAEILPSDKVIDLYNESIELERIIVRSIKTIKQTINAKEREI
ncbi:MAG: four helix bundle protein [Paludibacteraceae bacterium]|nr:four helix bundle protein [Paludibacteraceae bacterium]